tara:strand:- start:563 stop:1456 length:894 start_codon:yes stop_codon:yes gene_type:complete
MSSQPNIYWLASYPKSGNTWTRAFIANLLHEEIEEVDINAFHTGAIASGREWIESALDFDINELSHDEIDCLRPSAYRWISQKMEAPGYHKIHDAYTFLTNGEALIPIEATRGALCIIRNPFDVAISFAHHNGITIDQAIESMANSKYAFCAKPKRFHNQLRQWLLSWSDHVLSWVDASEINKMTVRYEDMKHNSVETFTAIASFLELPCDELSISEALERCKIEKLQVQEIKSPFKERSAKAERFFRKGIVGDWQNTLSDKQINQIINDHRTVMQRFGYLDAYEQPSECIYLKDSK